MFPIPKEQEPTSCSFAYKILCIGDRFKKPFALCRGKNAVHKFIAKIINEYAYCKKSDKKHFNKNIVMTEDDEKTF